MLDDLLEMLLIIIGGIIGIFTILTIIVFAIKYVEFLLEVL